VTHPRHLVKIQCPLS